MTSLGMCSTSGKKKELIRITFFLRKLPQKVAHSQVFILGVYIIDERSEVWLGERRQGEHRTVDTGEALYIVK